MAAEDVEELELAEVPAPKSSSSLKDAIEDTRQKLLKLPLVYCVTWDPSGSPFRIFKEPRFSKPIYAPVRHYKRLMKDHNITEHERVAQITESLRDTWQAS